MRTACVAESGAPVVTGDPAMNVSTKSNDRQRGATSVEYAIMLAVALIVILGARALGESTLALFESAVNVWP